MKESFNKLSPVRLALASDLHDLNRFAIASSGYSRGIERLTVPFFLSLFETITELYFFKMKF